MKLDRAEKTKALPKIIIKTIPHKRQRYPTVGDWFYKDGQLHINVSRMSDYRYEMLLAIHELVEALLCKTNGVTQNQVDWFDKKFEEDRKKGIKGVYSEPGNDYSSPYRHEHEVAESVERTIAAFMDIDFEIYEKEVCNLH